MRGETNIQIETMPFDEGKVSYIFRIYDIKRRLQMVGKIDKKVFN